MIGFGQGAVKNSHRVLLCVSEIVGSTLVSVELVVDGADSGPALDADALCYDIFSTIVSCVGFGLNFWSFRFLCSAWISVCQ